MAKNGYCVQIRGANACATPIGNWDDGVQAHTSGYLGWVSATVYDVESGEHELAVYSTREKAEEAARASELWNGQQWRVRPSRRHGRLIA